MKVRTFSNASDDFICLTNDTPLAIYKMFHARKAAGWKGHLAYTAAGGPYALMWRPKSALPLLDAMEKAFVEYLAALEQTKSALSEAMSVIEELRKENGRR